MANLAIIPARGGSKRIPRKNIKNFLGQPIITYSINAALQSGIFDEVMVSTDDEEIAGIAQKYGAAIPFMRSPETANDHATTFAVIEEVCQNYTQRGQNFDFVCCIYPCAPLISGKTLNEAYETIANNDFDAVFPVVEFSYPVQRSLKITNGKLDFTYPEYAQARSQDFPKNYHDSGQFYWMRIEQILRTRKIMTDNVGGIIISELDAQDIDNEIDWKLAELKFSLRNPIPL